VDDQHVSVVVEHGAQLAEILQIGIQDAVHVIRSLRECKIRWISAALIVVKIKVQLIAPLGLMLENQLQKSRRRVKTQSQVRKRAAVAQPALLSFESNFSVKIFNRVMSTLNS
jgi:hypothetical protein